MTTRLTYCSWVRSALTALGPSRPRQVYDWIKLNEPVPAAELTRLTPRGESKFEHNVRFARFDLKHAGVVISPKRGIWALKAV
jgi:hypothetical protein